MKKLNENPLQPGGTIFKRRHYGTPESFTLITINYIVVALGLAIFTNSEHKINWFFWIILGVLALYNAFDLYRHREEFNKISIIAYVISLAGLGLLFLIF
ncbi:MAG TPA: hypothetical protein VHE59_09860 [Mucilaginibacter sp.]|nr:hypothetical protein [Mucilaginibacter sp.]